MIVPVDECAFRVVVPSPDMQFEEIGQVETVWRGDKLRNFVRRFKAATGDSPLIYLQRLRIAAAKRMLESNHRTMQEIGDAVGYQDVAFSRSLFQRQDCRRNLFRSSEDLWTRLSRISDRYRNH